MGLAFRQDPIFIDWMFLMENRTNSLIYYAAAEWNSLCDYEYQITYGYKKNLYQINITFSASEFPHLAGFHYLKDLGILPRRNPSKIVAEILNNKTTQSMIEMGLQYEESVKPRLEAIVRLKSTLENNFSLFTYMSKMYPFHTTINADYLISYHSNITTPSIANPIILTTIRIIKTIYLVTNKPPCTVNIMVSSLSQIVHVNKSF